MHRDALQDLLSDLLESSSENLISESSALTPDLAGMQIFAKPVMAATDADDPLFERFKSPGIIGPHHLCPNEWMDEARSVASFFFPFSEQLRKSNTIVYDKPSAGWLHGRIEGQTFINKLMVHLSVLLSKEGIRCCVPSLDRRFWSKTTSREPRIPGLSYTSNWSERHAAFACGLGTFGLSRGLITKAGTAGRFSSMITSIKLDADIRPYNNPMEYCSLCGICSSNCPAGAITITYGKDQGKCSEFLDATFREFNPRYGCGKCQVGVPCEFTIPKRILED